MAAPVADDIGTPGGIKMDDGHQTVIVFNLLTTAKFWEKEVTPPGLDGGDAVEQTTMRNVQWRTNLPRALITLTEATITAAWDPDALNQIKTSLLNQNGTITIIYPDGSTTAFFGYLRLAEPQAFVEGEQPEIQLTIQPTNLDPATGDEEGPVTDEVTGT